MQQRVPNKFRLESIFAGMHSTYWITTCTFSGFMALYLSHYGVNDALVGITASVISLITIIFQLAISSFSDNNSHVPLKKIIILIYLAMLGLVALLTLVPLPMMLLLLVYSLTGGLGSSLPGLYNAQIIHFVNLGLPVNLGWPRGVSAMAYAVFAFFLGLLLERYAPPILMPICLILIVLAILMVVIMPRPEQVVAGGAIQDLAAAPERTSMLDLLKASRVMQVFLLSAVFMNAGVINNLLFLPRVIAAKGGTEAALGLGEAFKQVSQATQQAQAATARCPKDGTVAPAGTKFCPECGSPMTQPAPAAGTCPSCGAQVGTAKFCPECGAKIERAPSGLCPSCGADAKGAKFCPECGTKLS